MQEELDNYLVTAANSDIGSEFVERILNQKPRAKIIITTRGDASRFDGLPQGAFRHLRQVDLTLEDCTRNVAAEAEQFFQSPFCWLHCAGDFWHHKSIENTSHVEALNMIMSHYFTFYASARQLLPVMRRLSGGRVLAFSCNSVRYNYPDMAAFTPAKAALETLVKCMANEFLEHKVLVNCLVLPTVATKKVLESKSEEYQPYYPTVSALIEVIMNCFASMSPLVTGNAIGIIKYSPFFYSDGYYRRNREKHENPARTFDATY